MTNIKIKESIYSLQRKYVKRDIAEGKQFIQLDRNENALGYSKNVLTVLEKAQKKISLYPDIFASALTQKLSEIHRVPVVNIVAANGSFELINTIAQVFLNLGDEAITSLSTFEWYRTASSIANATVVEVPLDNDHRISLSNLRNAVTAKTKIIWLCNPNNPTGIVFSKEEITQLIESIPSDILIVLDEAYIDFVREVEPFDSVEFIQKYENVIFLRTFSKVYGLASLRIGYAVGHEYIIGGIRNFKTPMSTNYIAVEAATVSLDDKDFYNLVVEHTGKQLDYFYREFDKLGLPYIRSNANFLMVNLLREDSETVVAALREKYDILVRGGKEFGFPGWLRITIGTEENNKLFINALTDILK